MWVHTWKGDTHRKNIYGEKTYIEKGYIIK